MKDARPDARVAIFWHIPWPTPAAFGICPWQRELLDGLLGADLIGLNCSMGPAGVLETLERLAPVTGGKFTAQPNAGMPRTVEGRSIYLCPPE